ncbi:MAG: S9 family peptidase [Ponticaulis sp.]|nr:S9 family peptidase [Ponticaulis sp.]|tara:strand:- start:10798 stop:12990 length:2193 start_codon:yes stop_codon:yes gene_type:complete
MSPKLLTSIFALSLFGAASCSQGSQVSSEPAPETEASTETTATTDTDPYIWMEDVESERALDWVRAQNERSLAGLKDDPLYEKLYSEALEIVNASERIPYGSVRDGEVYNFWQDETNVRGLWRKTSLESYGTDSPEWETILDFDQLAADEDKNWVYKGANCFSAKDDDRWACLVSLSDGGKDATEDREFDLATKSFVEGGFVVPEAKSGISWLHYDTVLIATDWGGDGSTLTESGYPSVVKKWTRGTPLSEATEMFAGDKTDVGVWPTVLELEDGTRIPMAVESDTFFTSKYFMFPDGIDTPVLLQIPEKSSPIGVFENLLYVTLQEDWTFEGVSGPYTYKSGSLVAIPWTDRLLQEGVVTSIQQVFVPNDRQSIESVTITKDEVLMTLNDNVKGAVYSIKKSENGFDVTPLDLPENGALSVTFASDKEDVVFINYEDFLTPDSLLAYMPETGEIETIKSLPEKFDADGLVVEQFEATSTDGTKIPYFIVHKDDISMDGTTPTLLYGYGGFQVSMPPSYSALRGKLWLERGGAYVVANIRGGGEFGPEWHQAGLKTKRQIIYDDFIAVGEDLIAKGITTPEHLGIQGGSNGGLLMGVMLTQRPDLWNAVVVQVPLLDMLRYHLLLAGASWIDEYGDPNVPEEREWLEKMSPYHNFDPEADYPEPFFVTSTKDDRVHPAHARKMAKLFEDAGKPFLYYENIDGGHSAAANLKETANRVALEITYLFQKLKD